MTARFLTVSDVMDELGAARNEVLGMLRRGELPASKVGGRGVFRADDVAVK